MTFGWRFVAVPTGSTRTNSDILNANTVSPSFTPDMVGTYVLELRAYDGKDAGSDNVAVTVMPAHSVSEAGPANLWIGLKNSDDQGTQFDLRTELYLNDVLIAGGQTLCITEVTRNPSYAKEVTVPFAPATNNSYNSGDILYLRVLTRIGTNPDGSKCIGPGGSHNNAVGLRLYYDAPTRPSRFAAQIAPNPMKDYFLHSSSGSYLLNDVSPTGAVQYKDSSGVNYSNGNQWKEIGTWQMVLE